ncbi:helix-turn-helix transcriptional regulator [Phytomonospora sp. NPDC050363]|uniref:AraC family transcriptional regulator n=1 Tax=Phytomonospora sp. NPDC050363 TaxID=3155642 RepID=UPI0033DA8A96
MSLIGHPRVHTLEFRLEHAEMWTAHEHPHHELLWGTQGSLSAETPEGLFAVPAMMGVWIPAGTEHAVRSASRTGFYCTYVHGEVAPVLATGTVVVDVTPLTRELLLHLHSNDMDEVARARAEDLLLTLFAPVDAHAISLRMPADERLAAICRSIVENPADPRSLYSWGREVGGSVRNLSRLFTRETGLTFEQWRILARMRVAVGLLSAGRPVRSVAQVVGYRTTSSFVQAFRRVMGHTPGRYVGQSLADSRHEEAGAATGGTRPSGKAFLG